VVDNADYFLEAINEIRLNDVILVVSETGGTPVATITYMKTNDGATCTVGLGNTIAAA
jgi:hypothetical protein